MIERNYVTIDRKKSKEFREFLSKTAKNKEFWRKNKEYLDTHKVDLEKLEALYKS
jgi:ribonuclease HI